MRAPATELLMIRRSASKLLTVRTPAPELLMMRMFIPPWSTSILREQGSTRYGMTALQQSTM